MNFVHHVGNKYSYIFDGMKWIPFHSLEKADLKHRVIFSSLLAISTHFISLTQNITSIAVL